MAKRNPLRPSGVANALPNGTAIADFTNYADAVAYVERIIKGDFPANAISIVGSNLSTVERVRGKINYGRVALNGAITGSWIGLIFFLLFGTSADQATTQFNLGSAILIGAGFGMLMQVVRFSLLKSKRSFSSGSLVVAAKYEVIVPAELSSDAQLAYNKGGQEAN
ncbi:MAG: general stress protein [Rhodoluna sp.]|jgi:hypothetical protein